MDITKYTTRQKARRKEGVREGEETVRGNNRVQPGRGRTRSERKEKNGARGNIWRRADKAGPALVSQPGE